MSVSGNLMDSIAPHLAPPVTREPIRSAPELDGADVMFVNCTLTPLVSVNCTAGFWFADDDA
jgi:hypothetical protein